MSSESDKEFLALAEAAIAANASTRNDPDFARLFALARRGAAAADEIDRLRAALRGVLWMAEEWYDHGGNEDTLADDYKPALAEARAALGEKP